LSATDDFYEQVIQNLKPWLPAPPRLRSADDVQPTEPVPTNLISTAISSQDGPDTAPATVSTDTASPLATANHAEATGTAGLAEPTERVSAGKG
jgi:hypothetical protein